MLAGMRFLLLLLPLASGLLGNVTDTHLHVTNMSLFSYPWATLNQKCPCAVPCICDWHLTDYRAATTAAPADRLVFVEVGLGPADWLREAQWVQGIIDGGASPNPAQAIRAIMAQRPPGFGVPGSSGPDLQRNLSSLAALRLAHGVRAGAIDFANASAVEAVLFHFALLLQNNLRAVDFNVPVTPSVAVGIARIARALPALNLVLDHHGGPPVGGNASQFDEWESAMRELGALPNVYVKFGGLLQYYKSAQKIPTLEQVMPFATAVLDSFPGKAVFERNWFFWCVQLYAARRGGAFFPRRLSFAHTAHSPPNSLTPTPRFLRRRFCSNFLVPSNLNGAEIWSEFADAILTKRGPTHPGERASVLNDAATKAYHL